VLLRGEPSRRRGPAGIVTQTLGLGWGVLAEVPGREIVIGAWTRPWHQHVRFCSLPSREFAAFSEPGYVKIVWTLAAEPAGPDECLFVTPYPRGRHRPRVAEEVLPVLGTDAGGNHRDPLPGLPLVRRQAERQARQADRAGSQARASQRDWVPAAGADSGWHRRAEVATVRGSRGGTGLTTSTATIAGNDGRADAIRDGSRTAG
jgi:hypothetical protein